MVNSRIVENLRLKNFELRRVIEMKEVDNVVFLLVLQISLKLVLNREKHRFSVDEIPKVVF